jgi:triosephosphate isomerase
MKRDGQEVILEPMHLSMTPGDKRRYFIGGNWKSNGDKAFINKFSKNVLQNINFDKKHGDVIVAPPMIYVPLL